MSYVYSLTDSEAAGGEEESVLALRATRIFLRSRVRRCLTGELRLESSYNNV